jgi:hypothetical protein
MGFAQRLDNGNTLISWGSTNPTITEVTPKGEIALELTLPPGVYTYRSFKDSWNGPQSIGPGIYNIPVNYALGQNYPNPFNPATKIQVDIPTATFTDIRVYDILGRLVKTIVNSELSAGKHTYQLNASDFSTGVYFYTMRAGDFSQTKKMVVIK